MSFFYKQKNKNKNSSFILLFALIWVSSILKPSALLPSTTYVFLQEKRKQKQKQLFYSFICANLSELDLEAICFITLCRVCLSSTNKKTKTKTALLVALIWGSLILKLYFPPPPQHNQIIKTWQSDIFIYAFYIIALPWFISENHRYLTNSWRLPSLKQPSSESSSLLLSSLNISSSFYANLAHLQKCPKMLSCYICFALSTFLERQRQREKNLVPIDCRVHWLFTLLFQWQR